MSLTEKVAIGFALMFAVMGLVQNVALVGVTKLAREILEIDRRHDRRKED